MGKKTINILIADDEEKIRFTMRMALQMNGYNVDCAGNGADAIDKIIDSGKTGNAYDLLISDIQMPLINGEELLAALKRQHIKVPVLAITGYGDKDLVVRLMRNGCNDYLDKPFKLDTLLERIETILSEHYRNNDAVKEIKNSRFR